MTSQEGNVRNPVENKRVQMVRAITLGMAGLDCIARSRGSFNVEATTCMATCARCYSNKVVYGCRGAAIHVSATGMDRRRFCFFFGW